MLYGGFMVWFCRSESGLCFGIKILNVGCSIKVLQGVRVEIGCFFKYIFFEIIKFFGLFGIK